MLRSSCTRDTRDNFEFYYNILHHRSFTHSQTFSRVGNNLGIRGVTNDPIQKDISCNLLNNYTIGDMNEKPG